MHPARTLAFALGGALLLAAGAASAQSSRTNSPAPPSTTKPAAVKPPPAPAPVASFDAFMSIPGRNIFNARRYAGRTEDAPAVSRRDPVVESFSLLGTLDYPKGTVAFFEGTSAAHRKAAKVEETIGGCKITGIEQNVVRLEANGKPLELKVGYMLRREDDGAWQMREAERPSDYGSPVSSSSSFTSSFSSPSSSSRDSRSGSSSSSRDSRFGSSSSSRDSRSGSSSFTSRSGSPFSSNESPADAAQRRIREQDRNGDGKISRDEADSRLRPNFDLMDRNRDGMVDAEEYTAYYASRMGGSSTSTFSNPGSFNSAGSPGSFSGNTSGSSSAPPSSAPSSGGGGESELLRRLMEQRARENR